MGERCHPTQPTQRDTPLLEADLLQQGHAPCRGSNAIHPQHSACALRCRAMRRGEGSRTPALPGSSGQCGRRCPPLHLSPLPPHQRRQQAQQRRPETPPGHDKVLVGQGAACEGRSTLLGGPGSRGPLRTAAVSGPPAQQPYDRYRVTRPHFAPHLN